MLSACPVLSSAGCPRKRDLTHPLTAGCFQTSSSPPTSVTNNPRSLNLADRRNEPLFPAIPFTFIPPSEKSPLVSGGGSAAQRLRGRNLRPAPTSPAPSPFPPPRSAPGPRYLRPLRLPAPEERPPAPARGGGAADLPRPPAAPVPAGWLERGCSLREGSPSAAARRGGKVRSSSSASPSASSPCFPDGHGELSRAPSSRAGGQPPGSPERR